MEIKNAEKYVKKKEIKGFNLSKKRVKHFCEINNITLYNERDDNKKLGNIFINYSNNIYKIPLTNNFKLSGNYIGFEDPRVFSYKNNNYILVNALGNNKIRNMYLFNLELKKIIKLQVINNNHINLIDQKNWSPYIFNDKLYFIYSFFPLVVLETINIEKGLLKVIKGNIKNQSRNKENKNKLFGSTPLIPYEKNNYICFTHSRKPYLSVPVIYNPLNMNIEKIGKKLLFNFPKESNTNNLNWKDVQFPYDIKEYNNTYKLYIEFRNKCSGILYINKKDIIHFF